MAQKCKVHHHEMFLKMFKRVGMKVNGRGQHRHLQATGAAARIQGLLAEIHDPPNIHRAEPPPAPHHQSLMSNPWRTLWGTAILLIKFELCVSFSLFQCHHGEHPC